MSINTDNDGISPKYLGNGITKTFAFDFRVFAQTEVSVQKTSAIGTITTLVYGTDYTVSLNASQDNNPGGSITTTVAPIVGESLVIISKVSYTQLTTLTTQGNFDPVVLNNVHDKAVVLAQQLRGKTDLAIRFPEADGAGLNTILPSAIVRAKKAVVFDTSGNIGVSTNDFEDQISTVQTLVSQAQASATSSATSATSATNSATSSATSATSATNSASQALSSSVSASSSATQAQAYASSLQWSGTVNISANTILDATYSGKMIVVDTTAGNVTLTLPLISSLTLPVVIGVKKRTGDANTVTITRSGTNTIDNVTSKIISTQGASVSLIPNASGDWAVIDASLPSSGGGQQSIYFCGTTTTVSNVWTISNPAITSLYDGLTIQLKFDVVNTNIYFLNLNNFGQKTIVIEQTSTAAFAGAVVNRYYTASYYSGAWYLSGSSLFKGTSPQFTTPLSFYALNEAITNGLLSGGANIYNITSVTGNITGIAGNPFGTSHGFVITYKFRTTATLIHSSSFALPLSQNLSVQSGDILTFAYRPAYGWECINYYRADGKSTAIDNIETFLLAEQKRSAFAFLNSLLGSSSVFTSALFGTRIIADHFLSNTLTNVGATYISSGGGYYTNPSALTSNLFTGGVASAKASTGTATPDKAFDGNSSNYWYTDNGGVNAWLRYDCGTPKNVTNISLWGWQGVYSPYSFVLQASNDAVNWTDLYTSGVLSWSSSATELKQFAIPNTLSYRYYQLYMTPQIAGYFGLNEWQAFSVTVPNATLTYSGSFAINTKKRNFLVLCRDLSGSGAVNIDLKLYALNSSGSYVEISLTTETATNFNGNILYYASITDANFTNQAGWRIDILNGKTFELNGVVQWQS